MTTFLIIVAFFVFLFILLVVTSADRTDTNTTSSFGNPSIAYKPSDDGFTPYVYNDLRERPVQRPPKPTYAPPVDPPEPELPERIQEIDLHLRVQIKYIDVKGDSSSRVIDIRKVKQDWEDKYSIYAFCHLRNEDRTFRLSRVKELIEIETGLVYDNPAQYFVDRFFDSPLGTVTTAMRQLESEVMILVYMARADGTMRTMEREVIASYVTNRYGRDLNRDMLLSDIRKTYCTAAQVRHALKAACVHSQDIKQGLYDTAADIVATEKTADPEELGVLELIRNALEAKPTANPTPQKRIRKPKAQ